MISGGESLGTLRGRELYRHLVSAVFELGVELRPLGPVDVCGLFEDSERVTHQEIRSIFDEVSELLRHITKSEPPMKRFAVAISELGRLPEPVRWCLRLAAMDSNFPPNLLTQQFSDWGVPALDCNALKGIVPIHCAIALKRHRRDLVSDWHLYTDQLALNPAELPECSEEKIAKVLVSRRILSLACSGNFGDAIESARKEDLSLDVKRLLRDLVFENASEQEIETWATYAMESNFDGEIGYTFSSMLFSLKERGLPPTQLLRDLLLDAIRIDDGALKLLDWSLEYALQVNDAELFTALYSAFWNAKTAQKPVNLDLLIKGAFRFGLLENLSNDLVEKQVLRFADFRNVHLLRRIADESGSSELEASLDTSLTALKQDPEGANDLGLCLILVQSFWRQGAELQRRALARINRLVVEQSSDYQRRFEKIRNYRIEFSALVYATALSNPDFYELWRESDLGDSRFLQSIFGFFDEVQNVLRGESEFGDFSFSSKGQEALALLDALSNSPLAVLDPWRDMAVRIMVGIDATGRAIPTAVLAKSLRNLWGSTHEIDSDSRLLHQALNLQNSNLDKAANAALMTLARSDRTRHRVGNFREVAKSCGITINPISHAQLVSMDIARGEFDSREFIQGPDSETWQSLSVILDDVIHEVNQPIASIGNSLVELKFRLSKAGIDSASSAPLLRLEHSLRILANRIDEYRALSQEFGAPRVFKLVDLVRQVANELTDFASDRGVGLKVLDYKATDAPYVFGESFKLRLAIRNLVRNAIQAAEPSAQKSVTINLFNPSRSTDTIFLQVTDSGGGIPESLKESIFQKGITTKPGRGLGLGLSLTASVIKEIGGRIALEDTGPSGTTFVVQLEAFDVDQTDIHPTTTEKE